MSYKFLTYGSIGSILLVIGTSIVPTTKISGTILLGIGAGMLGHIVYLGYKYDIERVQLIKMNHNLNEQLKIVEKKLHRYEK